MAVLSGYRMMWMLVMFDLPVGSAKERREACKFREYLKDLGFEMCQLSVYLRFCSGKERTETLTRKVRGHLPQGGRVDLLYFTDKQYENIVSFESARSGKPKKNPGQFTLF